MRILTKKDINNMVLSETKGYKIYKKKDLVLKEDIYVEPSDSNGSSSDIASDLSKAKGANPTKTEFTVDGADYDGNASTKSVTIDVPGDNTAAASQNLKSLQQDPNLKNIKNKNYRFHIK